MERRIVEVWVLLGYEHCWWGRGIQANPYTVSVDIGERENRKVDSIQMTVVPRKTSRAKIKVTVPQTDSGEWGE